MRSLIVHGVLALVGLSLAYLVWVTPEEERPAEAVELVECEPEDVRSIALDIGERMVRLEARGDEDRAFWVTATRRPEDGEEITRAFVANRERVEEYLTGVAPLVALRALGEIDEETEQEVELGDGAGALRYDCAGEEHRFRVGATAFGTGDRYLQDAAGRTYLLAADAVRDLESAEALLMQRKLQRFDWQEVEQLTLSVEDRERRLLQRNRHDPRRAEWVDAAEPDRRNELFGNWLDRVERLRVQDYLELDAEPGSDVEGESVEPVPVLGIRFTEGGEEIGRLEMARVDTRPERYYVRTDATRAWVTVPRSVARQVEDDARTVVGLEPLDRPEPEPEAGAEPETGTDAGAATPSDAGSPTRTGLAPVPEATPPETYTPDD